LSSAKDIGITENKDNNFSEWYTQVVLKTQLADYAPVKGFMVLRPYGYSIWESIKAILDKQFKATGHQNSFLPLLIPENLLRREEEHFHDSALRHSGLRGLGIINCLRSLLYVRLLKPSHILYTPSG
jgi:prolyl-tRNA synthetase